MYVKFVLCWNKSAKGTTIMDIEKMRSYTLLNFSTLWNSQVLSFKFWFKVGCGKASIHNYNKRAKVRAKTPKVGGEHLKTNYFSPMWKTKGKREGNYVDLNCHLWVNYKTRTSWKSFLVTVSNN